jgi:hypothetical protein
MATTKEPPRRLGPSARIHALSLLTLPKAGVGAVLIKLSRIETHESRELYARVMNSWGTRTDRERVTLKLTATEAALVDSLHLPPTLVECPRWEAVYRDPNTTVEVTIRCQDKPTKRRTFRIRGGRTKMVLTELTDLTKQTNNNHTPKEATSMTTATKTRTRKKKPPIEDIEELEGLEELDDLEDLEEPDDEEELEEAEPAPKRKRSRKKAAAPEPEEDEEDEEEDEAPKRRSRSKKAASKPAAKKGAKRTPPTPPTRELPTGKLGPSDIAALAGVEARDVRAYLRKNAIEKDEELGRYVFTKRDAEKHAKAIKKAQAA